MSAFTGNPQRRPSYPAHHEFQHQGHREPTSQAPEHAPDAFGHQRSQSYHGFPSDLRPPPADPLPIYYNHPQTMNLNHDRTSRVYEQVSGSRRLSKEDEQYYETEALRSHHARQRSLGSSGSTTATHHYHDLSISSSGSHQLPSHSPHSPHSPQPSRHSRSPQTPPLTPSPREYPGLPQGHQHQYHLQHHHQGPRPAPLGVGGRLHKTSTREAAATASAPATVGPNRRLAHILSEQKRREKINGGFDELKSVIPDCVQNTDSKATILRKAVSYILLLEDELKRYTGDEYDHPPHHPESSHSEHEREQQ
ncbi:hypothetical protein EDD21DRAFT_402449 [Dissophora ornata]|nr:hypothetical protein EDD21DRAFT_402449 [Dissophora ornata]